MNNQNKTSELLEMLSDNLLSKNDSILNFIDFDECIDEIENLKQVYKTKRKFGVRTLCAVYDLPKDITTYNDLNNFFRQIRNTLTKKYAKFPYFKELGTFSIILCDNSKYENLNKEIKKLKDNTGLHMNTMLGTFLVDVEEFVFTETKTFGLITTGKQYKRIKQTLLNWISMNKKINNIPTNN